MIAKIIKGSDFKGLLDYLTKKDRGDIFDRRNLSAIGAADIAQEMGLAASQFPDKEARHAHQPQLRPRRDTKPS